MTAKPVLSKNAPEAVGPYSHGFQAGNYIFVSGQMPVDPVSGEMVRSNAGEKATQCMKNVLAILAEAGMTAENIVKTTIFLKDMDDFSLVNEAYASFFKGNYPARSCVEVSRLPKDVEVEIEVIAYKEK